MDKTLILQTVGKVLEDRCCFLVGLELTADNDITITIEKEQGSVDMDDCIAVNDAVLAAFDRDVEDYSLTVTSAGLDQPFSVQKQFDKAVGSLVEVKVKGGRKFIATLDAADAQSVTVSWQALETVEGKKKKVKVDKTETIALTEVNSVRYHIDFSE